MCKYKARIHKRRINLPYGNFRSGPEQSLFTAWQLQCVFQEASLILNFQSLFVTNQTLWVFVREAQTLNQKSNETDKGWRLLQLGFSNTNDPFYSCNIASWFCKKKCFQILLNSSSTYFPQHDHKQNPEWNVVARIAANRADSFKFLLTYSPCQISSVAKS